MPNTRARCPSDHRHLVPQGQVDELRQQNKEPLGASAGDLLQRVGGSCAYHVVLVAQALRQLAEEVGVPKHLPGHVVCSAVRLQVAA